MSVDMDVEFEKIKAELEKAKEEAVANKMVAEKTIAELSSLKAESGRHKDRVTEVQ